MTKFFVQIFKVAVFSSVAIISVMTTMFISFLFLGIIVAGIAGSAGDVVQEVKEREYVYGQKFAQDELLVVNVSGVILGEREIEDSWLAGIDVGVTYGYEVKEDLIAAADESDIKAVMLYINSPGGTIFGSQAIADGVAEYKRISGKPVIAFVSGMAASGGYWSALEADEIWADSGSTIGSIGVIFGPFKYYDGVVAEDGGILLGGVVTENGIQNTYISAGRSKDLGNPYRQLTQEELSSLQEMVNKSYADFVAKVAAARGIEPSVITGTIGALVYSEQQAEELNLIDGIANKHVAYERLAEMANVKNYKVTRLSPEPSFINTLLSAVAPEKQLTASGPCTMSTLILAYHGDLQTICQ